MTAFRVVVRTATARYSYIAIAVSPWAAIDAAYDHFGICSVSALRGEHE